MYLDNYSGDNNSDFRNNGELRCLEDCLRSAGVAPVLLDVGANRGEWCHKALKFRPHARIHCFEPSLPTYTALAARKFPANVVLNNIGLGSTEQDSNMHIQEACSEVNSLHRLELTEGGRIERVALTTVDAYATTHGLNEIDYLKIDTEGHDFEVLKGAQTLLRAKRLRHVQFEYGRFWIPARTFLRDVFVLLCDLDYDLLKILPHGLQPIGVYSSQLERFEDANYLLKVRA